MLRCRPGSDLCSPLLLITVAETWEDGNGTLAPACPTPAQRTWLSRIWSEHMPFNGALVSMKCPQLSLEKLLVLCGMSGGAAHD